jgi:dTDP-4-dehydrorhamnose reductase
MEKILIVGSHGMAGHVIKRILVESKKFNVFDIARNNEFGDVSYKLDVSDFGKLGNIILELRPHYIINCIGILNNDAENHPAKAVLINSYLPHFLAEKCDIIEAKLIHISSDCVFSGLSGDHKENDFKDGIGFYAQSKALGEVVYGKHLTIRTSIIGPELKANGIGLLHWFLNQKSQINGYTNALWSGVTTLQLAKSIFFIIHENNVSGIVHLSNNEKISKYDLLMNFKKLFGRKSLLIIPHGEYIVDKSVLNTRVDFNPHIPSYEQMLKELKDWVINNINYYNYTL